MPSALVIPTVLVSLIALPASVRSAGLDTALLEQIIAEITNRVAPTVVRIRAVRKPKAPRVESKVDRFSNNRRKDVRRKFFLPAPNASTETFRDNMSTRAATTYGAGTIISPDGVILTTSDVIRDADQIQVTLFDKRIFEAKQRWIDKPSGIAMITIDAQNLPAAVFADSDAVQQGRIVLSIGHPFGLAYTVNIGMVTGKGRHQLGMNAYEDFIQTDLPMSPGSAGGPLVTMQGEVIGINTASTVRGKALQGVSFAIPSNLAGYVAQELANEGTVHRGLLGVRIQDLSSALATSFGRDNLNGALVAEVLKGSAAERAGMKKGDIVVEVDGQGIDDAHHLKQLISFRKPGTSVPIVVERDKKRMTLTASLGGAPSKAVTSPTSGASRSADTLGISVEKLSTTVARDLGLEKGKGLHIGNVASDGLGNRMGLRKGDVILSVDGEDVATVRSFSQAVAKAKKKKGIRLTIRRGKIQFLVASPPDYGGEPRQGKSCYL